MTQSSSKDVLLSPTHSPSLAHTSQKFQLKSIWSANTKLIQQSGENPLLATIHPHLSFNTSQISNCDDASNQIRFSLPSVTISKGVCEKINCITFPRLTIIALKMHCLFLSTVRLAKLTLRILFVTETCLYRAISYGLSATEDNYAKLKKRQEMNLKTLAIYTIIFQPTIS